MSIVQLISSLEKYSLDILCLGFLVCGITSLVKKFIPQNFKKYITFLPFIIGVLVYGGYIGITLGFDNVLNIKVAENGIKCGMMATIYYVLYEQFIRGKEKFPKTNDAREIIVAGQLEGIIQDGYLKTLPKIIVSGTERYIYDKQYCMEFILSCIKGKEKPAITEQDLTAVIKLIIASLTLSQDEKVG